MRVQAELSGRGPRRSVLVLWGAIALVVVVVVAIPLTIYARGGFADTISVVAESDSVADGLLPGADVKYQGLTVGSVKSVTVTPAGRQIVAMQLDRTAAGQVPDRISTQFIPSSLFGVMAVTLVPATNGAHLTNGAVLQSTGERPVSAIDVLNDIGNLSRTLTGDAFTALVNRMQQVVTAVKPLLRSGFDLLTLMKQRQVMPLSRVFEISADVLDGANALTGPYVGLFTTLVEKTELYADPVQADRVTGALTGLVQTFITLGQSVGKTPQVATLLDAALTLGTPMGYTLGTLGPAVTNARELLRRLEAAMPKRNGTVQLRLGITLQQLPAITSALAPAAGGAR